MVNDYWVFFRVKGLKQREIEPVRHVINNELNYSINDEDIDLDEDGNLYVEILYGNSNENELREMFVKLGNKIKDVTQKPTFDLDIEQESISKIS